MAVLVLVVFQATASSVRSDNTSKIGGSQANNVIHGSERVMPDVDAASMAASTVVNNKKTIRGVSGAAYRQQFLFH